MSSTIAIGVSGLFLFSTAATFMPPIQLTLMLTSLNSNSCIDPLGVNFMQANGYYSQFAGVLSGFVFTAIILLLTISSNQVPKPITFRIALHSLFIAWFTLVDSCLLFATLAGDQTIVRASILGICADTILSFAALQVMLSIVWLFEMHNVDRSILICTRWMFQGVLFIIATNFIVIVGDLMWVKTQQDWRSSWALYFIYFLLLFVIPLFIALVRTRKFRIKIKDTEKKVISTQLSPITFNTSLGFTILLTVIAIYFQDFNESEITHINTAYFQLFTIIFIVMIAILLTLYQLSFPIPAEEDLLQEDAKNFLAHRYPSSSNTGGAKDFTSLIQPQSSQTPSALSSTNTVGPDLKTAVYRALPFVIFLAPILIKSLRRLFKSSIP